MQHKIICKLKSEEGSSLAFVIIIGVVILMLVASIMAIANSDFTFTQQSLESRQAYIDAKSVIEFGKIEIKDREKKLSDAHKALIDEENKADADSKKIADLETTISELESKKTTIYGNTEKVNGTLSFEPGDGLTPLGTVTVDKTTRNSGSGSTTIESSEYVFKIITENMRRKLDYKVDFDYEKKTTTGSTDTLKYPEMPTAPEPSPISVTEPDDKSKNWIATHINKVYGPTHINRCLIDTNPQIEKDSQGSELNVDESNLNLRVDDFSWAFISSMVLKAKNIGFNINGIQADNSGASYYFTAQETAAEPATSGEIRFLKDFALANQSTVSLNAKNVVFKGNLDIGSLSKIDISCDNLWIDGDFSIKTGSADLKNNIKAKNVIIDGDLTIGSSSGLDLECDTLWIKGDVTYNTNIAKVINTIKAKNVIIENTSNKKKAKNVIIENTSNKKKGNFTINGATNVDWVGLENLWIEGNFSFYNWSVESKIENKIEANNIIINEMQNYKNGSLIVGSGSKINIICTGNLWVKNVEIQTDDPSLANSTKPSWVSSIKAAQIIIDGSKKQNDGSVSIGDKTAVVWDATNFWLNGDMTTGSTSVIQEFRNINYLSAKNINLGHNSQLTITGAANKHNHMIVGAINPSTSNNIHLNITNFCSFTCSGLVLNWDSSLVLDSSIIKINGDFNLYGLKAPIELTCEYFDCSGKTTIDRLQGAMNFNQKNNELNLRFYGGYSQYNSTVNIKGADKVIFGSPGKGNGNSYGNDGHMELGQDNVHKLELNVQADAIYFDTNTIRFPEKVENNVVYNGADFLFGGKNSSTVSEFNIKTEVLGVNSVLLASQGKYTNVAGTSILNLPKTSTAYSPPTWPDPLNCQCVSGGNNSTITITNGLEEYY